MYDQDSPATGENVTAFPRQNCRADVPDSIAIGGEVLPAAEAGYQYLTLYVTDDEADAIAAFIFARAEAMSRH